VKSIELAKAYDPKEFESRIYQDWKQDGLFRPSDESVGKPYTIVMPPPNVTGILHMGHGLNNSLQDILIRYYRMTGRSTLWVPGTDHAGIATQNIVERMLAKEGLRRQDIGREEFLKRTWAVKEKHHDIITHQLEVIGCSCDWSRERFTMDEGLSRAVREAFVTLYERGLIYKGEYLINYCPHCQTALADDEVEYQSMQGSMWDIKYPYADGSGFITVATTRPETMFGDTAVAVHPDDERYKAVVGKKLRLPLTDREIPIIADAFVDMSFGTGMVKITPAHDPNDYQCGKRHGLDAINVLNPDGTLNDNCPEKYRNIPAVEARKLVVQDLKELGLLIKETPHQHDVGTCYRCHTVVEPYLSKQWFVKMDGMAQKALDAWKRGEINFYPKRWENTYSHWLENIHDWCISRQLWWGHRIPVWYCKDCGEMIVSRTDPTECPKCHSHQIEQDNEVLDTWFSSWLWPFSTLGWPDKTPDLEKFFPTDTLVSGYDIIFFWISRMIMASLEFMGQVPFHDIYVTGLVRDKQGRKMSKSLGNGIDPIEVVNRFGADAMKFTLAYMATQGQDIKIDMESFNLGSRFANKIWNASRFLLMNLDGTEMLDVKTIQLRTMDKWIYHKLNQAVKNVTEAVAAYRFNDAAQGCYDFFWNDFCDWYVEYSKQGLYSADPQEKNRTVTLLLDLLSESLKLMHPFVSFVTEEIYDKLPGSTGHLITQRYPVCDENRNHPEEALLVSRGQEAVAAIRAARNELSIPVDKKVRVVIKPDAGFAATDFFREEEALIATFVNASELVIDTDGSVDVSGTFPVAGTGYASYLFVRQAIDVPKEIEKLAAEREKNQQLLAQTMKKLSNPQFMEHAKQEAIDKEQGKKAEFEEKIAKADEHLKLLNSLA
jgi:valyl-tRNA synthetase